MNAPTPALVAPRPERLRLVGQRRQILAVMHQRLMFGMLVYAGIIALIALRILYLAAFGDHAGRKEGSPAWSPERGDIVDRDGQPLARTIDAWTIAIHPSKVIGDKLELARARAADAGADEEHLFRDAAVGQAVLLPAPPRAAGLVEAVNALGEPGLAIEREPDRLYPQTSLAAHVIGYTDIDGHGVAGMERAFDELAVRPGDPRRAADAVDRQPVQQALEHELLDAMTTFSAIGAAGVVMDIHTGEVLAMTSLPQLNPNAAGQGSPEARFNRATLGVYELGSTFKPFTVAMAMDSGHHQIFGRCTIARTSCTSTATSITTPTRSAGLLGRRDHEGKLQHRHRADRRPGRRDAAEGVPQEDGLPRPGRDRAKERGRTLTPGIALGPFETMTVGFGHGIAVTPLHLATGYATLFNGGIYRPATLLKVDRNHPSRKGQRVFPRTPATRCARCCAWSSRRAPARRPMRPAIASAARPAPPKSCSAAIIRRARWSRASRVCSRWTSRAM
jgi:cell division protein FtsI (penicillin-binding protein 3)